MNSHTMTNSSYTPHSDTPVYIETESRKHFPLPSNIFFTSKLKLIPASERLLEKNQYLCIKYHIKLSIKLSREHMRHPLIMTMS